MDTDLLWADDVELERRLARDQLAFFLMAIATGSLGVYAVVVSLLMESRNVAVRAFIDSHLWGHFLGGPAVSLNLIAALLLLGGNRFRQSSRAPFVLLFVVTLGGAASWCYEHAHFFNQLGVARPIGSDPLLIFTVRLLALIRIITLANVAAAVSKERQTELTPLYDGAVGLAWMAFLAWLLLSVTHIDWTVLPPRWRNINFPGWFRVLQISLFARGASFVLAAMLSHRAFANTSRQRAALRKGSVS